VLAAARFVIWTCALWVLWLVFVGTTQSTEVIAGLAAAAVTAAFVEVLRAHGLLDQRADAGIVARAWSIPPHVVFDFFLVLWILVRELAHGRRVRGQWVTAPFDHPGGPQGRFARALAAVLENETANGLVVDVRNDGTVLLHSLDTRPTTGTSVL
jgi:hypothetical protein